jgi:hypothetical protein
MSPCCCFSFVFSQWVLGMTEGNFAETQKFLLPQAASAGMGLDGRGFHDDGRWDDMSIRWGRLSQVLAFSVLSY